VKDAFQKHLLKPGTKLADGPGMHPGSFASMNVRLLTVILLTALGHTIAAQNLLQRTLNNDTMPNLVPNPGFEEFERLQCRWTQDVEKFNAWFGGWRSATQTTPDHFSLKLDVDCWSHPHKRTDGKASPHEGDCMAGIKVWGKGNTPSYWHEYLEMELREPLEAGTRYIAEFWTMRASFSNEASNNLGLYLSDTLIATRDNLPLYFTPVVNEEQLLDKRGWTKVSGVIEAKGGERFVVIGNFYTDEATLHERQPEGQRGAFYFIDDVNVRVAPPGTALTPKPKESVPPPPKQKVEDQASTKEVDLYQVEPEVGKRIRLDNLFFEFDKATLTAESGPELEKLVDLLTDYPLMRIHITGHTDDQGSDEYNRKLSEARAKAVVDHLVEEGIDRERLSSEGLGEAEPVAPNTTEEGRALNRRVEFEVVER